MYKIYCKHIFVYIFPCYFNWDSSFVTEVFPEKTKKKRKNVPCELRHFVTTPSVWGSVDVRKTFLTDLHWKSGRAEYLLFQSLTSHFDEFTSQLWAQERTSRSWLGTFQNGSDSAQIKENFSTGGWSSFPSLNTGPAGEKPRVESGTVGLLRPQWTEEKTTMWKVSQPAAAESQYPDRVLFLFYLYCTDSEYVHIKPTTFKTRFSDLSTPSRCLSWPNKAFSRMLFRVGKSWNVGFVFRVQLQQWPINRLVVNY